MTKSEIKIGGFYFIKVNKSQVVVRVDAIGSDGAYYCTDHRGEGHVLSTASKFRANAKPFANIERPTQTEEETAMAETTTVITEPVAPVTETVVAESAGNGFTPVNRIAKFSMDDFYPEPTKETTVQSTNLMDAFYNVHAAKPTTPIVQTPAPVMQPTASKPAVAPIIIIRSWKGKADFLNTAEGGLEVTFNDRNSLEAGIKEFSTGSCGWYANGKVTIEAGQPLLIKVAGRVLNVSEFKEFSTGSLGWNINDTKVIGGFNCHITGNVTVIGSKKEGFVAPAMGERVECQVGINLIVKASVAKKPK